MEYKEREELLDKKLKETRGVLPDSIIKKLDLYDLTSLYQWRDYWVNRYLEVYRNK